MPRVLCECSYFLHDVLGFNLWHMCRALSRCSVLYLRRALSRCSVFVILTTMYISTSPGHAVQGGVVEGVQHSNPFDRAIYTNIHIRCIARNCRVSENTAVLRRRSILTLRGGAKHCLGGILTIERISQRLEKVIETVGHRFRNLDSMTITHRLESITGIDINGDHVIGREVEWIKEPLNFIADMVSVR
jgi:hypothetical protein